VDATKSRGKTMLTLPLIENSQPIGPAIIPLLRQWMWSDIAGRLYLRA
jgi:hypothetical protein